MKSSLPDCLHVFACKKMAFKWDSVNEIDVMNYEQGDEADHGYNKPAPQIRVLPNTKDPQVCILLDEDDAAVIGIDRKGFVCFTCSFGRHDCRHIKSLMPFIEADQIPDSLVEMVRRSKILINATKRVYLKTALSSGKITWKMSELQKSIFDGTLVDAVYRHPDGSLCCLPDFGGENCQACELLLDNDIDFSPPKRLVTRIGLKLVKVPFRRCSCGEVQNYCGSKRGILNMGEFLIGHDLLKDYMIRFLTGSSESLVGFHDWMVSYFGNWALEANLINYQQWRMSWYSFMDFLEIDYCSSYTCEICGCYPSVLVCDATALGFRKEFAQCIAVSSTDVDASYNLNGSSYNERTLVKKKNVQKAIKEYSVAEINEQSSKKLSGVLAEATSKELMDFFFSLERIFKDVHKFPKGIVDFINCLSSTSPVCSYFPPSESLFAAIQQVKSSSVIGDSSGAMIVIQNEAPVIFGALATIKEGKLPHEWHRLFNLLFDLSKTIFRSQAHSLPVVEERNYQHLSFFPNWSVRCDRGSYAQDKKGKSQNESCRKNRKEMKKCSLTPGLFTVYCEHGICYGFDVMESHESANIPFTIFRTRFPKAPEAIIYDNSCHLHTYCLGRDPGFFRNCIFAVDRFHWKNHTGCAPSYNMSAFKRFDGLNSQINEQRNAELKRLKSQLSFMNEKNFTTHCKLFLWHRNLRFKGKLPCLS